MEKQLITERNSSSKCVEEDDERRKGGREELEGNTRGEWVKSSVKEGEWSII